MSRKAILNQNYEIGPLIIAGAINEIKIQDFRNDVTPGEINFPIFSFPGQRIKKSPELSPIHQKLIFDQISNYFNHSGNVFNITCKVVRGYKEFSATVSHEREYVHFEIQLELFNLDGELQKLCSSTAYYKVTSMDAKEKFSEQLYQKAKNPKL
ncbi:hypothetical protein [Flammeovirga sp. SJP92]|uniref:hypothetical protein n=1 Tax=Flammeovirga sp. SJP92 TaxID=1775430 RepID=UPI0007890E52|nr:hypothetical protein [Flammeovirga sp. SJP92]KXX69022.1 hypothetical protein AVL50_17855 [Flammeovirga sp. SJP92]